MTITRLLRTFYLPEVKKTPGRRRWLWQDGWYWLVFFLSMNLKEVCWWWWWDLSSFWWLSRKNSLAGSVATLNKGSSPSLSWAWPSSVPACLRSLFGIVPHFPCYEQCNPDSLYLMAPPETVDVTSYPLIIWVAFVWLTDRDHGYGAVACVFCMSDIISQIKGSRDLDITSGWRGAMGLSPLVTLWLLLVEMKKITSYHWYGVSRAIPMSLNHPGTHKNRQRREQGSI